MSLWKDIASVFKTEAKYGGRSLLFKIESVSYNKKKEKQEDLQNILDNVQEAKEEMENNLQQFLEKNNLDEGFDQIYKRINEEMANIDDAISKINNINFDVRDSLVPIDEQVNLGVSEEMVDIEEQFGITPSVTDIKNSLGEKYKLCDENGIILENLINVEKYDSYGKRIIFEKQILKENNPELSDEQLNISAKQIVDDSYRDICQKEMEEDMSSKIAKLNKALSSHIIKNLKKEKENKLLEVGEYVEALKEKERLESIVNNINKTEDKMLKRHEKFDKKMERSEQKHQNYENAKDAAKINASIHYKNFTSNLKFTTKDVKEKSKEVFTNGIETGADIISRGKENVTEKYEEAINMGKEGYEKVVNTGKEKYEEVVNMGKEGYENVVNTGKEKYEEVVNMGKEGYEKVVNTGKEKYEEVVNMSKEGYEKVVNTGKEKYEETVATGKSFINKTKDFTKDKYNNMLNLCKGMKDKFKTAIIGKHVEEEIEIGDGISITEVYDGMGSVVKKARFLRYYNYKNDEYYNNRSMIEEADLVMDENKEFKIDDDMLVYGRNADLNNRYTAYNQLSSLKLNKLMEDIRSGEIVIDTSEVEFNGNSNISNDIYRDNKGNRVVTILNEMKLDENNLPELVRKGIMLPQMEGKIKNSVEINNSQFAQQLVDLIEEMKMKNIEKEKEQERAKDREREQKQQKEKEKEQQDNVIDNDDMEK